MRANAISGQRTISDATVSAASNFLDRWALRRIQQTVASAPLRFMLWDGFELPLLSGPPVATIAFKNRGALFSWLWDPDLNFGEAYMFGGVTIHGDLPRVLEVIYEALGTTPPRWRPWQSSNDVSTAKENVHQHYDLGTTSTDSGSTTR